MSSKIRKGDNVVVTKGKDKGKKGKVLNIDKLHNKAVVDGVNLYKRHIAPKQADPGGIKEVESAISISNLSIEASGKLHPYCCSDVLSLFVTNKSYKIQAGSLVHSLLALKEPLKEPV